jgi:hypothetical protein
MGFLSGLVSSVVKTVISPVAVVKDVVNVATGEEPNATKDLLESAGDDIKQAADDAAEGDLI